MPLFSIIFQFTYSIKPYTGRSDLIEVNHRGHHVEPQYLGGFLGVEALFAALNITDRLKGIFVAPKRLTRGRGMAKEELVSNGQVLGETDLADAPPYSGLVHSAERMQPRNKEGVASLLVKQGCLTEGSLSFTQKMEPWPRPCIGLALGEAAESELLQ